MTGQGRPRASKFVFARLRYESGDWDYNPKVAANVLNSIVEYTTVRVFPEEVVVAASSEELLSFPCLFMTGHKLVRFAARERDGLRSFVEHGGLLFSNDCNHDVNGLYARTFEQEMRTIFGREGVLPKLPTNHPLYEASSSSTKGRLRRRTSSMAGETRSSMTICAGSSAADASASCTATRMTGVSGITTGATSGSA